MTETIPEVVAASTDNEKLIFQAIDKNDITQLQTLLLDKQNVNIFDENNMTPLQHACYKGNKEVVQLLLDQGADVNVCQHEHKYTALHFAGLSGKQDVCSLLLLAGAKSNVLNTVGRTPSQMAAFVGNHNCVAIINNFIPKSDVECYTKSETWQGGTKPPLPPYLLESFYKFVMHITVHPVRVTLNLQRFLGLIDHLNQVGEVLKLMSMREMNRGNNTNEVMSFKFYYLSWIVSEVATIQASLRNANVEPHEKKVDATEVFIRKLLKVNKDGNLEVMENHLRETIRNFTFRECTIFKQMVATFAGNDPPPAINVISAVINGQRGFIDTTSRCSACGEERPAKKCSKCKDVQYCDRECQRLHWFVHKKSCMRVGERTSANNATNPSPDANVTQDMQNIFAN